MPEKGAYEVGGQFLLIDGYSQLFMMLEISIQGGLLWHGTYFATGGNQLKEEDTKPFENEEKTVLLQYITKENIHIKKR